jgi:hypothetical protein
MIRNFDRRGSGNHRSCDAPPTRAWAAALWVRRNTRVRRRRVGTSTHSGMDCVAARLGRFLTLDALRALCPRMETEGDLRTPTTH